MTLWECRLESRTAPANQASIEARRRVCSFSSSPRLAFRFDSRFLYARNVNRLGGGVKCPGNLNRLADVRLNRILVVQLIRRLGGRVVENILTWGFGEVRPVEYARLLFRDAFDSLHRRLVAVQVLVGDFAFERGSLSGSELDDNQQ